VQPLLPLPRFFIFLYQSQMKENFATGFPK